MDKKLRETTKLCVEIMNSRRQAKGKLGHVVQIRSLFLCTNHSVLFSYNSSDYSSPNVSAASALTVRALSHLHILTHVARTWKRCTKCCWHFGD